jgi:PAS domain S-box-containing protein
MRFRLRSLFRGFRSGNTLTAGEAKFQAFIKSAGDSIFITDQTYQITEVNDSACRLLNYSVEEFQKMKIFELMTADAQEGFASRTRKIDKEGSLHERKFKRKDGSLVDTEVNVRPVEGVGYIGIVRDITERKKTAARILERESQLTAFFETIEGAAAFLDTEKKYRFFNNRFIYDHLRLNSQAPYIGEEAYDLFPDDIRKARHKLLDNVLKGNKEVIEVDFWRNDQHIYYRSTFNPVIIDGKVMGVSYYSVDLSKTKEAEIKLSESEEKFRMSFMISRDAFYIGSLDEGRIIDINNSFHDMFGYTREECIGKTTTELNFFVYPEERTRMVAGLKANGSVQNLELTLRRKNGEQIIVSVAINVWELNNQQVIMAVIRDITEHKRVAKELAESELRFREVLDNSLTASYKRNMQTNNYDYLSPVFKKITGYTQQEINNMPLDEVIGMMHPDDVEVVRNGITNAIAAPDGVPHSLEYRFKHKTDGGFRWLNDEFILMKDEQRQPVALIGSVSDITERKRIETELIERTEQMALFVEYSPASLAMFDNDMRYIATSRRWLADYNLRGRDIIGKTHYEVFPEINQEWKDIHQRCLKGSIETREDDSFPRADGTMDWLKWEIRPWHRASGEIGGIIMFTEVLTEQKESQLKFKHLVEKSLVGVYIIQKGRFVYVNPKFAEYLGYTQEEMLKLDDASQVVYEKYKPDELSEWRRKVDAGIIDDFHIDLKYRRKDGKIIWAEVYCGETFYKGAKAILGTFQDITERKNVETAIKEQAETFSAIIEHANESILLLSPDVKVLQFNKTAKDRLRLNRGKEVYGGANFLEYIYPGTEDLFMAKFSDAMSGKYPDVETCQTSIYGNTFWLRTRMYPVYDTHQKLIGITLLAENITERKKFEEQQLLNTSIVNSTDDAIISKNLEGIITSWNKGAEKVLGYMAEEVIGMHISIIVPPQLGEEEEMILTKMAEGKPIYHLETRRKRKDGTFIDVSLTISPIRDSMGKITGASKILRDITEAKKAEESIKQSEANYRQLFDNSPAPMWVIDEKTSAIKQVNKACIRNYGFSEKEFLSMTIRDISPADPGSAPKTDTNEMFFMGSQRHVKKSGELIDVVTSSIPIRLNGEINTVMIAIDVTEKNLYEKKLTKAAIKAQEEERYEIGGELHDNVCQILAGSLMCLELMKSSLPTQSTEMFNHTHRYINQATLEIRNLSHRLAPAFFNRQSLEEAVMELLNSFNVENKFSISLTVDSQFKKLSLNRDLQLNLYRILQEQLANIKKHAKATKIEVDISLKKKNLLQMKITDNGVGFNVKTTKEGIGLANMNRRVQLFSGHFTINSAVGKGCKVLAEIPLTSTN